MSVIVKGMEMPKACGLCPFNDYCYCMAKNLYVDGSATHGRASFCPLVELPEKHGDLIDADALIAKCGDWYTEEGTETGFIGTIGMLLKDAPTVVGAEGEEVEK